MKKIFILSLVFLMSLGAFGQERMERARKFKAEGNYVYALAESFEWFNGDRGEFAETFMEELADEINSGNFGIDAESGDDVYSLWMKNMEYLEKYFTENCIYNFKLQNIKKTGKGKKSNTSKFQVSVCAEYTEKALFLLETFREGYENAYSWNWKTSLDWPYVSCYSYDGYSYFENGAALVNCNGKKHLAALMAPVLSYEISFNLVNGKKEVLYSSGKVLLGATNILELDNCGSKMEKAFEADGIYIVPVSVSLIYETGTVDYDISCVEFNGITGTDFAKRPLLKSDPVKIWSYIDEIPSCVTKGFANRPDIEIEASIIAQQNGMYMNALEESLLNNSYDAPDIFVIEDSDLAKFTKTEADKYVLPFSALGIDVEKEVQDSEIAKYIVENGSNRQGELVSLGYQSASGVFIYRRSLAKAVFGTDNPKVVQEKIGGLSGNWEEFLKAAELCKKNGVAIVSGYEDMWKPFFYDSEKPWVVDGRLCISAEREAFMDYAKFFVEKNYTINGRQWTDTWFAAMKGKSEKPVLGFFGPAWFLNYLLAFNCDETYGDWAICNAPVGFVWGGAWIFVNKELPQKKIKKVQEIIRWITLDSTENGLLYKWANAMYAPYKDTVISRKVMKNSKAPIGFMANQDMFEYFVDAETQVKGNNISIYDEMINSIWLEEVSNYAYGRKSKARAMADFKQALADRFNLF